MDLFDGLDGYKNNNSDFLGELNKSQNEYISILDSVKKNNKITSDSLDIIRVKRNKILNEYARENVDKGEMYYIFDRSSKGEDSFNLCSCEEGKSHEVITVSKDELPEDAFIDSVLCVTNGEYILDDEATNEIKENIIKMIEDVLQVQNEKLNSYRIDGHEYEIVEYSDDRVWLIDNMDDSGEVFEEINFPEEYLGQISEGDLFVFESERYLRK